jgi:hypothetical protein
MKKIIFKVWAFRFLLCFFIFISCENEETQNNLNGIWTLLSHECCDLPKTEFNVNEVTWYFDTKNNEVRISNNIEFSQYSQYPFELSGTYNFEIKDSILTIFYNDYSYDYGYGISTNSLFLSWNIAADGSQLIFSILYIDNNS